jgi:hypothetical protein
MLNKLVVSGLAVICTLVSAQLALSQGVITDEKIMSSFAKIVRGHQYICRSCYRVQPLEDEQSELSYKVVCNYGLTYKVVLTPSNNMIVRPINGLQLGALETCFQAAKQ